MMGDYFYLEIETLESKVHHITCTASGFFVNGTKYNTFDPSPLKKGKEFATEDHPAELLKKISPSFRRAYSTLINALELVRKKVHVSVPGTRC